MPPTAKVYQMPKMKTHRGAAKRFSFTAKGKVKFKHAKLRHCLEQKSKKAKKSLSKPGYMASGDVNKVVAMMPYAK